MSFLLEFTLPAEARLFCGCGSCGATKSAAYNGSRLRSIARIIVARGHGVGGPAGFETIRKLAKVLGGAIGSSRSAVDAGWISYAHQAGQTWRTVRPGRILPAEYPVKYSIWQA